MMHGQQNVKFCLGCFPFWWTFIEIHGKTITPLSITHEFYNQTFVSTLQITTSDNINFTARDIQAHQPQICTFN